MYMALHLFMQRIRALGSKKILIVFIIFVLCFLVGGWTVFFLTKQTEQGQPIEQETIIPDTRIKTSSEVEGYVLSIVDSKALEQLLSDYGFWDFHQWDQYKTKASQLYIVFTDKIQPLYRLVTQDKSILSSYGVTFDKGNAFVFVQIDPTIDDFDTASGKIVAEYVGRFLYSIQSPAKKTTLSEDDFLKSLYNGPVMFRIVKT